MGILFPKCTSVLLNNSNQNGKLSKEGYRAERIAKGVRATCYTAQPPEFHPQIPWWQELFCECHTHSAWNTGQETHAVAYTEQ